jgi:hypothetical protein
LFGGGILNGVSGMVTLTNSTLSGNSATVDGGGIWNAATLTLTSSIVANSPSGGDCNGATPTSGGHNLDSDGTCVTSGGTDQPASDPLLGPLADNGGPTLTHLPQIGSPVIDTGGAAPCPTATDQRGVARPQRAACDIGAVEVEPDRVPPTVTVPANISVPATGPSGAVVSFTASAEDDEDGPLTPTCDPPSGSTFPLGTTTVTCSAEDAAGNSGSASFSVTVVDTTPPALTVPGTINVLATSPAGAVVTYSVTATDDIDGPLTPTCDPPSGSTFRIGTATVTCTATDAAGNTATPTFQVVVGAPAISQLSPNRLPLVSTPQTLTIRGANFVDGATVTIGSKTYAATVVSSTELRVRVVPRDVFVYGWLVVPTATVRVTNPGGATSNSLALYLAW